MKRLLLSVWVMMAIASASLASVPGMINFQGVLKDSSGALLTGDHSMVFSIYDAASAGSSLWTETQTVAATDGLYSVRLGASSSIPASIFDGSTRYLGVKVGSDAEMTPRVALVSVSYALTAGSVTAETSSGFGIYSVNKSTDAADAALLAKADNSNGMAIQGVALGSDSTAGWFFNTGSGAPTGVTGMATNGTNTGYGIYGFNASSAGYAGYFSGRLKATGDVYLSGIPDIFDPGDDIGSLYVDSEGKVSKAVASPSSARYKDNIAPLTDDFSKILLAEPKSFNYKANGVRDIGYIAEELDAAGLKELVIYNKEGQPDSVRYNRIHMYLLEVIKQNVQDIQDQKIQISELEKRVGELEGKK